MANATALEDLVGNMDLAELAQRSGRSIESIVAFAMGSTPRNGAPAAAARQPKSAEPRKAAVETRTRGGREDLDQRLLEAIRKLGTAKAKDLDAVGGDIQQRRAALHRLIERKQIRREGVARGTTYRLK